MKILSIFATAVLALGLCGAASAEVAATPDALATSPFNQCAPEAAACDGLVHRDDEHAAQDKQQAVKVDEAPLPVPELETSLMFMLGLVVLGVTSRRRSSERFDR